MIHYRRLLALLLVAVYAVTSACGVAFIVCVEGDGMQSVEPVGAACCTSVAPLLPAGDEAPTATDESVPAESCGDCLAHLPAVDVESMAHEDVQPDVVAAMAFPHPAILASVTPLELALRHAARGAHEPPPRPSPTVSCLRSVILRC